MEPKHQTMVVCYKNERSKRIARLSEEGLSQNIVVASRGILTNFQERDLHESDLFLPVDSFLRDILSGLKKDRRNVKTVLELLSEEDHEVREALEHRHCGFCDKYSLDDSSMPAQAIARKIVPAGLIPNKVFYSPIFYNDSEPIPIEETGLVEKAEQHDLKKIGEKLPSALQCYFKRLK